MKVTAETVEDARAVTMLRALANPARFRIVQHLGRTDACIYGDIAEELPLVQSSVSFHLKVLRDAGIIHGTVEGPNRRYCLNPDALGQLRVLFAVLEKRGRRAP